LSFSTIALIVGRFPYASNLKLLALLLIFFHMCAHNSTPPSRQFSATMAANLTIPQPAHSSSPTMSSSGCHAHTPLRKWAGWVHSSHHQQYCALSPLLGQYPSGLLGRFSTHCHLPPRPPPYKNLKRQNAILHLTHYATLQYSPLCLRLRMLAEPAIHNSAQIVTSFILVCLSGVFIWPQRFK
jgi:hypothetical protein